MYELIYTSTQNGLTPGKSGFTTVACTNGMPPMYIGILEGLSTYDPLYLPGNPLASQNPVDYAYRKISFGSRTLRVFSRIAYAGLDYSGRSNIIAHHIIPEDRDNIDNLPWGPVSIFLNPRNFRTEWNEPAHKLPPREIIPANEAQMSRFHSASTWQAMFGKPIWAEAVARKYIEISKSRVKQNLYATVPAGEPEQDLLAIIAEIMPFLTAEQRNDFTFSTYFSRQPGNNADSNCFFRCILPPPQYKYLPVIQRLQPDNIITKEILPEKFVDMTAPLQEPEPPAPDNSVILQGLEESDTPSESTNAQNNATQHIQVGPAQISKKAPQNNVTQHIQVKPAQPSRSYTPPFAPGQRVDTKKEPIKPKSNLILILICLAVTLIFGGVGTMIISPELLGGKIGKKLGETETPQEQPPTEQTTQPPAEPVQPHTQNIEKKTEAPVQGKPEEKSSQKTAEPTPPPPVEKREIQLNDENKYDLFVKILKKKDVRMLIGEKLFGIPDPIKEIKTIDNTHIEIIINEKLYKPYPFEIKMKEEYLKYVKKGSFDKNNQYVNDENTKILLDKKFIKEDPLPQNDSFLNKLTIVSGTYNPSVKGFNENKKKLEELKLIPDDVYRKKIDKLENELIAYQKEYNDLKKAVIPEQDSSTKKKEEKKKGQKDKKKKDKVGNDEFGEMLEEGASNGTVQAIIEKEKYKKFKEMRKNILVLFTEICNDWNKQTYCSIEKLKQIDTDISQALELISRKQWADILGINEPLFGTQKPLDEIEEKKNTALSNATVNSQGNNANKRNKIRNDYESAKSKLSKEKKRIMDEILPNIDYLELKEAVLSCLEKEKEIDLNKEPLKSLYQKQKNQLYLQRIQYKLNDKQGKKP